MEIMRTILMLFVEFILVLQFGLDIKNYDRGTWHWTRGADLAMDVVLILVTVWLFMPPIQ